MYFMGSVQTRVTLTAMIKTSKSFFFYLLHMVDV